MLWKTGEDKEKNRARTAIARRTPTLVLPPPIYLSLSPSLFPSISLSLPCYGVISCKALLSRCGNSIFATNLQPPSSTPRRLVLCPVTLHLRVRVFSLLSCLLSLSKVRPKRVVSFTLSSSFDRVLSTHEAHRFTENVVCRDALSGINQRSDCILYIFSIV